MPAKGQLMAPKVPLRQLHEEVMERIDGWSVPVGAFIVGGRLLCMRRTAPTFDQYAARMASHLVGVYDKAADSRVVMDDLRTFYPKDSTRV